jgi:hypothetical protein
MKNILVIACCFALGLPAKAQNLQVILQFISAQVDTGDNIRVSSSMGSPVSISDQENGIILTTYLLDVEEVEDTTAIPSISDAIGLRVFPNPTPDIVNLSRQAWDHDLLVNIYDTEGKFIRSRLWQRGTSKTFRVWKH